MTTTSWRTIAAAAMAGAAVGLLLVAVLSLHAKGVPSWSIAVGIMILALVIAAVIWWLRRPFFQRMTRAAYSAGLLMLALPTVSVALNVGWLNGRYVSGGSVIGALALLVLAGWFGFLESRRVAARPDVAAAPVLPTSVGSATGPKSVGQVVGIHARTVNAQTVNIYSPHAASAQSADSNERLPAERVDATDLTSSDYDHDRSQKQGSLTARGSARQEALAPPDAANALPTQRPTTLQAIDLADQLRLRFRIEYDGAMASGDRYETKWKITNEGQRAFEVSHVRYFFRTTRTFRLACESQGIAVVDPYVVEYPAPHVDAYRTVQKGGTTGYGIEMLRNDVRAIFMAANLRVPEGWSADWFIPRFECRIAGVDGERRTYALDFPLVIGPDVIVESDPQPAPRAVVVSLAAGAVPRAREPLALIHDEDPTDLSLQNSIAASHFDTVKQSERMIIVAPQSTSPLRIPRRELEELARRCRLEGRTHWSFPPVSLASPGGRHDNRMTWDNTIDPAAAFVLGCDGSFGLRFALASDRKGTGHGVSRGDIGLLTTLELLLGAIAFAKRIDFHYACDPPRRWTFAMVMDMPAGRHLVHDSISTPIADWRGKPCVVSQIRLSGTFDFTWSRAQLGTYLDEVAKEVAYFFGLEERTDHLQPGSVLVTEYVLPS